ncbi:extracellular solute-binding protein [Paenibacillus sepulcri]|uniref:Extracellular solute-binding protein n=1 Tax=Paenibacillus sepulcri TaxID=359917 RepID=A0ABS7C0X8_9BACL|nr:extracellular solute-binding protein [Paenibacillus sepulcri]
MRIRQTASSPMRQSLRWCLSVTLLIMPLLLNACTPSVQTLSVQVPEKRSLIRFVASEYSSETRPLLEKLVKQFTAMHPDIDIELQVANWDILDGIYTAMISQGQPPDLLNTNVYAHFAKDGLLNDFNELLSPELKAKFYPNLLGMDEMDEHQYALPYVTTNRNLYYNRELFQSAGIASPPATWEELRKDALLIKKTGLAHGFGVDLTDNEIQAYLSYFFFGAGGGWIKDGKWTINSPENIAGLSFMKELFDQGLTDPEPTITTRDEKQRILGDGKLAMMISGNYFSSVMPREFPKLKWGVGPIPVKKGVPAISFGVQDVLVSFKTDHTDKKALSAFIDFLYQDPVYEEMVLKEGFVPVTRPIGDKLSRTDNVMKRNLDAMQKAKFYPIQQSAWQAVMDTARKMGDAVLYDHLLPEAALDQLQKFAEDRSGQ